MGFVIQLQYLRRILSGRLTRLRHSHYLSGLALGRCDGRVSAVDEQFVAYEGDPHPALEFGGEEEEDEHPEGGVGLRVGGSVRVKEG